jgi:hypothetical protein
MAIEPSLTNFVIDWASVLVQLAAELGYPFFPTFNV